MKEQTGAVFGRLTPTNELAASGCSEDCATLTMVDMGWLSLTQAHHVRVNRKKGGRNE
jgi:hypothetical protein